VGNGVHDIDALLQPSVQEDGFVDMLAEFENGDAESNLTED